MRKCTKNDIANALGISRVSVWKVLEGKGGTSAELERQVIEKALELGYPLSDHRLSHPVTQPDPVPQNSALHTPSSIAVAVSRPESSMFWMDILHSLAREMANYNINVLYTYLPTSDTPGFYLPRQLTSVNGFVVMNVYDEVILRQLCALPTPKLFMDTIPSIPFRELTGDLLLIEGRSGMSEIVEYLLSKGVRDIGFIGDYNYAQTNYERFYGFEHAMNNHGIPIRKEYCLTTPILHSYPIEIAAFLDALPSMPRAFLCASDFIADVLYRKLSERGYRVPQDIAIAGFDGAAEFTYSSRLTTLEVNPDDISKQMAMQLLHRIRFPNSSKTISYVCPTVRFRESTEIVEQG